MKKIQKNDTFVSHSSKDKRKAYQVVDFLEACGLKVWFDETCIPPGGHIPRYVQKGLASTRTVIVLLSANSVKGEWVRTEAEMILFEDPSNKRLRIIPVMIGDCKVPKLWRPLKYIDARKGLSKSILAKIEESVRNTSN